MKLLKLIKCLFVGIVLVVIVFLVSLILVASFSKKNYLEVFGYSFFEVKSYSMYPELEKGDLIVVKKRESSEYEVGMIVTYLRPSDDTTTTHMIVSIDGNKVTTKGINEETNKDNDLPFDIECIVGEVVTVWRGYGNVKEFVTNPIGIIIIILTGFLIVEGFNFLEDKFTSKENSGKEQG